METWSQHWTPLATLVGTPQSALSSSFPASASVLQQLRPARRSSTAGEQKYFWNIYTGKRFRPNSKASQAPAHAWAINRVCLVVLPDQRKHCSGSPCWGFPWPMLPLAVSIEWSHSIEGQPPLTQRNNMLFLLGRRLPSAGILRRLSLLHFSGEWTPLEKQEFEANMRVIKDFVSEEEELGLIQEIEPHLRRLPYESSHWDDAIHGYRESERRDWSVDNRRVLDRISRSAFKGNVMPHVHILDLAEEGVIKPHVDSVRFCGHTIAGLSLLSDCVMRLAKVSAKEGAKDLDLERKVADLLLPRRSLYIMSHVARYQFTHEVLAREESWLGNSRVVKRRRLSVICRNEP